MAVDLDAEAMELASRAKLAERALAISSGEKRTEALLAIADSLEAGKDVIMAANKTDLDRLDGVTAAFRDRLLLDEKRIKSMAEGVRIVAKLVDPVGTLIDGWTLPNGLRVEKVSVPIGVILVIYESRPNVTADAAALTLKSGNAVILRGGKEAVATNKAIAAILSRGLRSVGLPEDAVVFVESTDRELVKRLMLRTDLIDVVIPRGGEGLIAMVVANSRVPVIYHGAGICHVYVDASADIAMAEAIVYNAKCQRPGVCNAMETLLVHRGIADKALPRLEKKLSGVELRGCDETRKVLTGIKAATEEDWSAEYLDRILSIKVVASVEEAIDHIEKYGSHLADAIVTSNIASADQFTCGVNSAAVYVNASTRFTDGGEFGLGAEIGISTQKLHARGPMGVRELTTTKYVVRGTGQIRK